MTIEGSAERVKRLMSERAERIAEEIDSVTEDRAFLLDEEPTEEDLNFVEAYSDPPTWPEPPEKKEAEALIETGEATEGNFRELAPLPAKRDFSLADIKEIGMIAVASKNFPDLYTNEQAVVRILAGREIGLQPMTALRDLFVIEGKVSMSAGLIASMIKANPKYDYRIKVMTSTECVLEFYEDGVPIGESPFSIADADQAGINRKGGGWSKYPRNMLFARALTNGARWFCPDAFDGAVYTPEELNMEPNQRTGGYKQAPAQAEMGLDTSGPPVAPVRTSYAETEDMQDEVCPVHYNHPGSLQESKGAPVRFFMRGKMRNHAHPMGNREWCNKNDVRKEMEQEAVDTLLEAGFERGEFKDAVETMFSDLAGIALTKYRLADWQAIIDNFREGGEDAKSVEDETEQTTLL